VVYITKGQIEKTLKEELTNVFRQVVGKGPERVSIKIVKNFVICEMYGILTTVEKQLLKLENGEEQIKKLRDNLFLVSRDKYYEVIEEIVGAKVMEIVTKVSVKNDARFSLIVFKENIEKKIEGGELNKAANLSKKVI
jgi:uncharacterized protein YbcI